MDKKLLTILVCPICKGTLQDFSKQNELHCRPCGLAYPIQADIPVMLTEQARALKVDERVVS